MRNTLTLLTHTHTHTLVSVRQSTKLQHNSLYLNIIMSSASSVTVCDSHWLFILKKRLLKKCTYATFRPQSHKVSFGWCLNRKTLLQ